MRLSGKNAVVTGGGSGIGEAIARGLAAEGCRVVIAGRQIEKLHEAAARYKGQPAIEIHAVDVADRANVDQLVAWAAKEMGPIHILVNAAGINIKNRSMAQMPPEDWDRIMAINATGTYNCMHAVLAGMRKRRDGLIINVSSTNGKRAWKLGGVAYTASKFAVGALSAAVANEEAANGIRVTTICPGEVDTPILANRPTPVSAEHRARILQPEDVAAAALMVALLPPRAHVAEIVIKPVGQEYV